MLLCDLDHFKQVNDTHGHQAGDQVLRVTASLLAARARAGDLVARPGGDEFAVLCADLDLPAAMALADALVTRARELPSASGPGSGISISIGVATLEAADRTSDALMARADSQLHQVKRCRGRACGARSAPITA